MSLLRNIARGLRTLFRKEQVDRELDEELRAYQDMAADENMRDGMSRKEALRVGWAPTSKSNKSCSGTRPFKAR